MAFAPELQPVIDELLPLCKALGEGAYAVSIGGSYGKGTYDRTSDLDFRLFCERRIAPPEAYRQAHAQLQVAIDRWADRGITIDGCWVRTISEIDAQVDAWCNGTVGPVDLVWAIWGYHVLTDVFNQMVIDDPDGILAGWHSRLETYPPKLKRAILDKHLKSIRYWRQDYHYRHKVERGDVVFLASLTARLVHDLIQILFALNEAYYAGDGNNLIFVERFDHVPERFAERVHAALYPASGDDALEDQYRQVCSLIDETLTLVDGLGQA
ncbi:MAG: DUF4037 domain-containing protein [Anaerolineae bacterium]|nr:DUF4037 domain-containing protein [Anaerolineae bacterium]